MEDLPPPETIDNTFDVLAKTGIIPGKLGIRLRQAVGFNNIAVHNYETIDWVIVHTIASRHLDDFAEFAAKSILRKLSH